MSSSRTPSTPSEGEIVEDSISDTEKATTSQPSVNGTSVNRNTRPRTSPVPPANVRSPARQYSVRSPRRERSRSPYREYRGEKRRRDDEYTSDRGNDSRRSHYRHDGKHSDDRRQQKSYADIDRGEPPASHLRYEQDERRYQDKRQRTRSRSPYRHDWRDDSDGRRDKSRSPFRHGRNRGHGSRKGGPATEQSVSERGRPSVVAQKSRRDAESRGNQVQQDRDMPDANYQTDKADTSSAARSANSDDVDSTPADEATMIEERRKRREAIKAKYRGQATPLLVQALQLGNKTGSTASSANVNDTEHKSTGSPPSSPPQTPRDLEPASPVLSESASGLNSGEDLLGKDISLKSLFPTDTEEPSAADYDPTMDMQEDRIKQDRRQHGDEMSASAYDETKPQKREIPVPGTSDIVISTPSDAGVSHRDEKKKKSADVFDMFAEDFDEDEFAMDTSGAKVPKEDGDLEADTKTQRFEGQGKQLAESMLDNWDDPEGYYRIILGELLDGRYNVQANLGKGVFSAVVRARDLKSNGGDLVAIKVIRANDTMKKAGMKEIGILEQLAVADPDDKKHIVRFYRHFEHKGHLCMVFENLSLNLREVVKRFGRDVGINIRAVRQYAQQIFLAASLLRKCNLLHADLKPDNILVNEAHSSLKICDLGSAASYNPGAPPGADEITPYLVSRYYRAPEIILGMAPDPAIDVWSIGCTLYELYTGKILFPGRSNNQMLKVMMECRGKFPTKMLKRAAFQQAYFDDLGNFHSIEKDKLTGRDVPKLLNIAKPVKDLKMRLVGTLGDDRKMDEGQVKELNLFRDLLEKCLELNPEKRLVPGDALKHPFINRAKA